MGAHPPGTGRGPALRAYERCRRTLAEELRVSPSEKTEAAYLALLEEETGAPGTVLNPAQHGHGTRSVPAREPPGPPSPTLTPATSPPFRFVNTHLEAPPFASSRRKS